MTVNQEKTLQRSSFDLLHLASLSGPWTFLLAGCPKQPKLPLNSSLPWWRDYRCAPSPHICSKNTNNNYIWFQPTAMKSLSLFSLLPFILKTKQTRTKKNPPFETNSLYILEHLRFQKTTQSCFYFYLFLILWIVELEWQRAAICHC